ncbi:MAG TPA: SWIM zinc finger family protein, partial [Allocoleopsis sp.]
MSFPPIAEALIRRNATDKSFSRGEDYYTSGAVFDLCQRGNLLQARIEGSEVTPYRVDIGFDAGGITQALCTCPYNFEGWCKHIVATLLTAVRQPQTIEARPTLEQLLDRLNPVQTQRLIQELVAEHPDLMDAIDRHITLITAPVSEKRSNKKAAKTPRRTSIDPAPFRRQVKQIIRQGISAVEEGYDEEDPITDEIIEVIDKAQAFTEQGDGNSAIAILEAITSTCADEADDLSSYMDLYTLLEALDEAWTEAILSADLTEDQQTDLDVMLAEWQDALDGSFAMSLEALRQGWDYLPLQQVLQGHITAQGAWAEEPPDCADDLALIRLKILDRQGRDQEYLYLAEAEGQTTQYLTKLAELGQTAQAVEAAKDQITTPQEAFALAKVLREQEHISEALEVAQLGLALPDIQHYELADWTSDIAEGLEEPQAALNARIIAFKIKPSFRDYRLAEHLAGADWKRVKKELIAALRRNQEWRAEQAKIDIFLYEGLIDDAIAATPTSISSYNMELVCRV